MKTEQNEKVTQKNFQICTICLAIFSFLDYIVFIDSEPKKNPKIQHCGRKFK